MFDREGHQVAVVDLSTEALKRLDTDFNGTTVVGTGIDEDVLKNAGIEQADVFLALTSEDNPNIMAAQIVQHVFRVPRVVVRIYDPPREDTFHELGLETVCPTTLVTERIYNAIMHNQRELLEDGVNETLPGETLARTHTSTMPVVGTPTTRRPAEAPPADEAAAEPGRRDQTNPSWRQRLFRQ
jgi:trk system potassium uptake protein TrkA